LIQRAGQELDDLGLGVPSLVFAWIPVPLEHLETLRLCRLATEVEEGYLGKWLAQPQQRATTISLYM
jgi:hypothetical protein